MHSAIYKGWLRHRRFYPKNHRFSYRVFMMYLDLDELESVFKLSPFWSTKAWRPARFRREDYLGDAKIPLDTAIRSRIKEETGTNHKGPIRVLTNLRFFGFIINPITCYYCFDELENLQFMVVEVTNTPWRESVNYVLRCEPDKTYQRIHFEKQMHVSPFNPMNMNYQWCNNLPEKRLNLHLECECENKTHVDATMALKREEISTLALARILIEYPLMTVKVAATIYWQALRLWIKRVPIHDHPASSQANRKITQPYRTRT